MKRSYVMLLAGLLAMSNGFSQVVAAECTPPTREEIEAERNTLFAQADTNDNNALSQEEFDSFIASLREAREDREFTCLDANSDGQVSAEEFSAQRLYRGFGPRGPF